MWFEFLGISHELGLIDVAVVSDAILISFISLSAITFYITTRTIALICLSLPPEMLLPLILFSLLFHFHVYILYSPHFSLFLSLSFLLTASQFYKLRSHPAHAYRFILF